MWKRCFLISKTYQKFWFEENKCILHQTTGKSKSSIPDLQPQSAITQTCGLGEKDPDMVRSLKKGRWNPGDCLLWELNAAKNKTCMKMSYVMIVLIVAGCILMVIEGKKVAKKYESLTSLNLEKKAHLREEATMKAKTE